jgi:hypothetical protein
MELPQILSVIVVEAVNCAEASNGALRVASMKMYQNGCRMLFSSYPAATTSDMQEVQNSDQDGKYWQ